MAAIGVAVLGSCSDSTAPVIVGPPSRLEIISGDLQSGTVGAELAQPLVARIVDDNGHAVANQVVNFRVTRGGGSVFGGAEQTNQAGEARERWTLGTSTSDSQVVEVRAVDATTGAPLVFGVFRAIPIADQPATITVTSGASQVATPAAAAPDSLAIRVTDRFGNPVPGVRVAWAVGPEGGTLNRAVDTTSSQGYARTRWTAPAKVGSYTVTGTVSGLTPATFRETVVEGPVAQLLVDSGTVASTTVGTTQNLVVRVVDAFGNPIPQKSVSFVITAGNGSLSSAPFVPVTSVYTSTGADGRARVAWRIGGVAGMNTLQVTTPGLPSLTFNTLGVPSDPTTVSKLSGDYQVAPPGTVLPVTPTIVVRDVWANGVPGVRVTFAVTGGGGTIGASTVTTDASGQASVGSWTLGAKGANTLTATIDGVAPVTFTATALTTTAGLTISFSAPTTYGFAAEDSLAVTVSVSSRNPIASVRASVGDREVTLTAVTATQFTGWVPLTGVPRDTLGVVVTATDATGATTDAFRPFILDRLPVLTIVSPENGAVVPQNVPISATCTDDDPAGCTSIRVTRVVSNSSVETLLTGTTSVNGTVSLAAFAGQNVKIRFIATDSAGRGRIVDRIITISATP